MVFKSVSLASGEKKHSKTRITDKLKEQKIKLGVSHYMPQTRTQQDLTALTYLGQVQT